ncbi:hypothetical protein DGG96_03530 [Legionella qingyii]|uniref:Uncharacterized protein n=1 Tax=Legionella qingyii TaxID=2184757 RepID=A0A317U6H6_9GAMM|nr:hypothetical protein DGG96_03530 [Legionella qingyii]
MSVHYGTGSDEDLVLISPHLSKLPKKHEKNYFFPKLGPNIVGFANNQVVVNFIVQMFGPGTVIVGRQRLVAC